MHMTAKKVAPRLALALQEGTSKPDISTPAAVKRTLLNMRDTPGLHEPALE